MMAARARGTVNAIVNVNVVAVDSAAAFGPAACVVPAGSVRDAGSRLRPRRGALPADTPDRPAGQAHPTESR